MVKNTHFIIILSAIMTAHQMCILAHDNIESHSAWSMHLPIDNNHILNIKTDKFPEMRKTILNDLLTCYPQELTQYIATLIIETHRLNEGWGTLGGWATTVEDKKQQLIQLAPDAASQKKIKTLLYNATPKTTQTLDVKQYADKQGVFILIELIKGYERTFESVTTKQ